MNATPLIAVSSGEIAGQTTQLVDARLLHDFLEVGRDFSNWIKSRIDEYEFVQGEDYLLTKTGRQAVFDSPNLANQTLTEVQEHSPTFVSFDSPNPGNQVSHGGDRKSKAYFVTLDMAKELAMVERTAIGRQARRYFIDCEKKLHTLSQPTAPTPLPDYALAINLRTANLQAINRQAQADVAGENAQRLHARREALLRLQRYVRLYGCLPAKAAIAGGGQ